MAADFVSIDKLADYEGRLVTLKGWLYNKRGSKGLYFLVLRDGSGLAQCVVSQQEVEEAAWQAADEATQESALEVTGRVVANERQTGGYEVQAQTVHLLSKAEDYPITAKAHGVEFLMDRRHLWLRSRRQWAILRVRNRVIMSIHQFFQERGFIQMDAPILTGNAVEGTSTLFE
ncbi:MAG: asparagine--tRNA ligase, partial [Bacteroidetes bacterium]|nr:asparagine--tRNA ligase [Bacteroidota bacterium]